MSNPSRVLPNNPFSSPTFSHPTSLGSVGTEPYVIFQIRDSVARGAKEKGTIALYMPSDLSVNYKSMYEESEMSIDQLAAYTKMATGSDKSWTDIATSAVTGGVAAGIDSMTSVNAVAFEERRRGRIINPHQAVLFKGVGLRTFEFKFDLFAKNPEETENIRNIIHVFKYAMMPDAQEEGDELSKRYFFYPENFVIGLFSPEDRYLFKISTCVLEDMTVDYAGSGTPSFFALNGAPVHIKLSLQFKELEAMTKNRISQGF